MVNVGNFFGSRGRVVDPTSARQLAMACKAKGLVLDKDTNKCRDKKARGRAPVAGPSVASLRAACKAQGLVLDVESKQCRESRRGAGLPAARTARAAMRVTAGPTQKDMMEMCKARGLVFDRETKQCRPKKVRGGALEEAYKRGSVFAFGSRGRVVNPGSDRQLAMACKAQGLVLDKDTKQCRESRRGAGLPAARTARAAMRVTAGPTQKDMIEMCKARGLVFDRETKQCRPKKVRGSALEEAYKRGSLFFGVNQPASAQRTGVTYHTPASRLGNRDVFDIMGPVRGPITGPASFIDATSVVAPAKVMKHANKAKHMKHANKAKHMKHANKAKHMKHANKAKNPPGPRFGTYARGLKGELTYGKM